MKRKLLSLLVVGTFALSATACSSDDKTTETDTTDAAAEGEEGDETEDDTLTVGATLVPHAELLNLVKDDLASQGVQLEVVEFNDYTLVNPALTSGDLDANYFQHQPYLDEYIASTGDELVNVANIHVEPIRVYSQEVQDVTDVKDGSKVAIPNDATNEGRALLLLEKLGLIEVDDEAGILATLDDITSNPRNLEFVETDPAMLPRTLSEVSCAVIQTNIALESGLKAVESIAVEDKESPYANAITVRKGDENDEEIQKLITALQSEKVKTYIEENYDGAVVPAF